MSKYVAYIHNNCVACGACMKICPKRAISIKYGIKAKVNTDLCIGCGLCMKTCPAGIIEKKERT